MESIEHRIEKKVQEIESKQARLDREAVQTDRKIKTFSGFAWFFVILGGIVGIFGLFLFSIQFPKTPNELGDFYSGTVGSLWSLAGLFFIYVAFLGQKKQLSLQQIELTNSQLEVMYTQAELKGQKEAMKAQNELLAHQKFESTFFKLMENHITMVEKMSFASAVSGKDYFKYFDGLITSKFGNLIIEQNSDPRTQLLESYVKIFSDNSGHLSYYFRNLYQIFKFIKESKIKDKKRYSDMIRAQMSPSEVVILLVNCISENGKKRFHPLLVEFKLLKHIENKEMKEIAIKYEWYPERAFG